MKTIGLIGGMSWHSTLPYYSLINQAVNQALGGNHSAKILLHSVDFAEIAPPMQDGDWQGLSRILAAAAGGLQTAGADFFLLCSNTPHKVAPEVQAAVGIPLLHIADATAAALLGGNAAGKRYTKVGLLGTRFTMQQGFFKDRLHQSGIEVFLPTPQRMEELNEIIFSQLIHGQVTTPSRFLLQNTVQHMAEAGAEAVVLGCTELSLLLSPHEDLSLPFFDTTEIHATAAARFALEKE